jgi:hypothetical protein
MDHFPRLPNGDIDENSDAWQQHVIGCVLAAESMEEIATDDYAFIEHSVIAKWNSLEEPDRISHALSSTELYLTVQRALKAQAHMRNLLANNK